MVKAFYEESTCWFFLEEPDCRGGQNGVNICENEEWDYFQ
jgi:hypothetical protein